MYRVFVRNFWTRNPHYPGGREPSAGRKRTLARHIATEARTIARAYNNLHTPGFLSRKAEFEEE